MLIFFKDLPRERGKGCLRHFRRGFDEVAFLPQRTEGDLQALLGDHYAENGSIALAVQGDRDRRLRLRQGCPACWCSGGLRQSSRHATWTSHRTLGLCEEEGIIL